MSPSKIIAVRDEFGFRPLCYGQQEDGTYIIASESCALDAVSAKFIRDVEPGEIVVFDKSGVRSITDHCNKKPHKICIFEYLYFARPDSVIEGKSVHVARTMVFGNTSDVGGFGGLFELDLKDIKEPVLVSGTDGVGTKLRIAFLMDKHDTVGIDCVAMDEALAYVEKCAIPVVVKADGLALGKGVIIAETRDQAKDAVTSMMKDKVFGDSGSRVVIEEFLTGPEVSVLSFTDGKTLIPMVSSM